MSEEEKIIEVSEGSKHVYCMSPGYKNEFGLSRAMKEVGVIKGLAAKETKNYLLIPIKGKNGENTAWQIFALPKEGDISPETWKKLHEAKEVPYLGEVDKNE